MSKIPIALWIVVLTGLISLATYSTIAWFTYPCEAYKYGYLSTSYAPGRCVR